jgi:hypothetical protein
MNKLNELIKQRAAAFDAFKARTKKTMKTRTQERELPTAAGVRRRQKPRRPRSGSPRSPPTLSRFTAR